MAPQINKACTGECDVTILFFTAIPGKNEICLACVYGDNANRLLKRPLKL